MDRTLHKGHVREDEQVHFRSQRRLVERSHQAEVDIEHEIRLTSGSWARRGHHHHIGSPTLEDTIIVSRGEKLLTDVN